MNADERQAIRTHHVAIVAYCHCCESICRECSAEYPCDAIKLLDAWEEREKQWIKGATLLADAGLAATGAFDALANQPCPKCGVKL